MRAAQPDGLRLPDALSAGLRRLLGVADHQLVPDLVPGHAHRAVAVRAGFNWGRLIGDPAFSNALKNTLLILVIQVPIMIALATVLAVLLNSPLLKAEACSASPSSRRWWSARSPTAAVFRLMFNLDFGIINKLLDARRPAERRLVLQRHAGDGGDHHRGDLALGGLQRHHHPRRPAVDPRGCLRGGDARRRQQAQAVLLHHLAAAEAGHRVLRRAVDHRHHAAVHRAVPDHQPRRAGRRHRDARPASSTGKASASLNFGYASAIAYTMAALAIAISLLNLWLAREREMRRKSLRRTQAQHRAALWSLTPLALIWLFPLWMMVGLLDHARQRHLQPRHRAAAVTTISSRISTICSATPTSSAPSASRSRWR